jgi:hypothetical protein
VSLIFSALIMMTVVSGEEERGITVVYASRSKWLPLSLRCVQDLGPRHRSRTICPGRPNSPAVKNLVDMLSPSKSAMCKSLII